MTQAPKKRLKSRSITMYVDDKYNDKLLYLRHTTGVTAFFERCLDELEIPEEKIIQLKDAISVDRVKEVYMTENKKHV